MFPLQLLDSFLLEYNIGQALLLVFVLATVGLLPMKSRRLLALHALVFGLVFMATPAALMPSHYLFLGIALVVVAPMMYVTAER